MRDCWWPFRVLTASTEEKTTWTLHLMFWELLQRKSWTVKSEPITDSSWPTVQPGDHIVHKKRVILNGKHNNMMGEQCVTGENPAHTGDERGTTGPFLTVLVSLTLWKYFRWRNYTFRVVTLRNERGLVWLHRYKLRMQLAKSVCYYQTKCLSVKWIPWIKTLLFLFITGRRSILGI